MYTLEAFSYNNRSFQVSYGEEDGDFVYLPYSRLDTCHQSDESDECIHRAIFPGVCLGGGGGQCIQRRVS